MAQTPDSPLDSSIATILVVDDDMLLRKITVKALEKPDYRIIEACNGQQALECFSSVNPSIVLLDASMPIMDGFECCLKLRDKAPIQSLPILMITGLEDDASINKAFDVGATDFIQKPFNPLALRRRVELLIRLSSLNSQLEAAHKALKAIADIDKLTNLYNRRFLDDILKREWHRSLKAREPLSIVMCDVDCFKRFNDTYGHLAGDTCLQQVGEVIRASIRWPIDIGARYGGEEFMLVLPNTPLDAAILVAERIRQSVRNLNIAHHTSKVPNEPYVTMSLGVATNMARPQDTLEELVQEADQNLYRAKGYGRNQVWPGL